MTVEEELEYLRSRNRLLDCLKIAGISKWSGYKDAMSMFDQGSIDLKGDEDED